MCFFSWSPDGEGLAVLLIDETIEHRRTGDNLQRSTLNGVIQNSAHETKIIHFVHRGDCEVEDASQQWLDPGDRYNRLFRSLPGRELSPGAGVVSLRAAAGEMSIKPRPLAEDSFERLPDPETTKFLREQGYPVPFTDICFDVAPGENLLVRFQFALENTAAAFSRQGFFTRDVVVEGPLRTFDTIRTRSFAELKSSIVTSAASPETKQEGLNIRRELYNQFFSMLGYRIDATVYHVTIMEDPKAPLFLEVGERYREEKRVLEGWSSDVYLHHFRPYKPDFLIALTEVKPQVGEPAMVEEALQTAITALTEKAEESARDSWLKWKFFRLASIVSLISIVMLLPAFSVIQQYPRITFLGAKIVAVLLFWVNNTARDFNVIPLVNERVASGAILALGSLILLNVLSFFV